MKSSSMKVYLTIENEDGETVLETSFVSVSTAIDYLSRHAEDYPDVIDF